MSGHRYTGPSGAGSLWLCPQDGPVTCRAERWADYPHLVETVEEFFAFPETVQVIWEPFEDFTCRTFDADEVRWGSLRHVADVARRMLAGEDIPPLFRWKKSGEPFDGIHRAHAASRCGIDLAPTVYLEG